MSQITMVSEITQKDEDVRKQIEEKINNSDFQGYVLLLRGVAEENGAEPIHMFNVGNNLDELTDMLFAASEYLPSQEMEIQNG